MLLVFCSLKSMHLLTSTACMLLLEVIELEAHFWISLLYNQISFIIQAIQWHLFDFRNIGLQQAQARLKQIWLHWFLFNCLACGQSSHVAEMFSSKFSSFVQTICLCIGFELWCKLSVWIAWKIQRRQIHMHFCCSERLSRVRVALK